MANIRWKDSENRRTVLLTKTDGTVLELNGSREDINDGIFKDGSWINIYYKNGGIFIGKIVWFRSRLKEEPTGILCKRWRETEWGSVYEVPYSNLDNIYLTDRPENLYSTFL